MRLTRAMLYVKDLHRMAEFYANLLGRDPIARTANWAEFEAGGATFALHAIPAHIADEIEIASPPEPREETPYKLTFAVPDVAAERQRLKALEAALIERPWGSIDIIDPEGNIFAIEQQPPQA